MNYAPTVRWLPKKITPSIFLEVHGYGIYEEMPKKKIDRPIGTGDWLLMHFHQGAEVEVNQNIYSSCEPFTMLWEPQAKQSYFGLEAGTLHSWVHFHGPYVRELQTQLSIFVNQPNSLSENVFLPFLKIIHEECNQQTSDSVLSALFLFLFRKIAKEQKNDLAEGKIPDAMIRVQNYIEQNFTNAIFLQNLAAIANCSVPHFCFLFKKYFSVSPIHYVTNLKMEKAKYLLGNINYNVGEIADSLGYKDIYQFSKLFKVHIGVSPLQFRKNCSVEAASRRFQ